MLFVAWIARRTWSASSAAVAGIRMIAGTVPWFVHVVFAYPPGALAYTAVCVHAFIVALNP